MVIPLLSKLFVMVVLLKNCSTTECEFYLEHLPKNFPKFSEQLFLRTALEDYF